MPPRAFARVRLGLLAAAMIAAGSLVACSGKTTDLRGACPDLDTSNRVPTCTRLFPGRRGVKLPLGPKDARFGAVSRGGAYFVDAAGRKFRTERLKQPPTSAGVAYANTVYRARITDGVATNLTPVLRISEEALLTHIFGGRVLRGRISARLPDGTYDLTPKLPVVIKLDATAHRGVVGGTIANADRGARVGDGRCLKRLAGSSGPLTDGFTHRVKIARVPSMHVPHDDELVLEWSGSSSGMGQEFYPSVATALGGEPLGSVWNVSQHGVPNSGPALELRLSKASVTSC